MILGNATGEGRHFQLPTCFPNPAVELGRESHPAEVGRHGGRTPDRNEQFIVPSDADFPQGPNWQQHPNPRAAGSTEEQPLLSQDREFWAVRAAPGPADQAGVVICSSWATSWLLPDVVLHLSSHQHLAVWTLGSIGAEKQLSFCKRVQKKKEFCAQPLLLTFFVRDLHVHSCALIPSLPLKPHSLSLGCDLEPCRQIQRGLKDQVCSGSPQIFQVLVNSSGRFWGWSGPGTCSPGALLGVT